MSSSRNDYAGLIEILNHLRLQLRNVRKSEKQDLLQSIMESFKTVKTLRNEIKLKTFSDNAAISLNDESLILEFYTSVINLKKDFIMDEHKNLTVIRNTNLAKDLISSANASANQIDSRFDHPKHKVSSYVFSETLKHYSDQTIMLIYELMHAARNFTNKVARDKTVEYCFSVYTTFCDLSEITFSRDEIADLESDELSSKFIGISSILRSLYSFGYREQDEVMPYPPNESMSLPPAENMKAAELIEQPKLVAHINDPKLTAKKLTEQIENLQNCFIKAKAATIDDFYDHAMKINTTLRSISRLAQHALWKNSKDKATLFSALNSIISLLEEHGWQCSATGVDGLRFDAKARFTIDHPIDEADKSTREHLIKARLFNQFSGGINGPKGVHQAATDVTGLLNRLAASAKKLPAPLSTFFNLAKESNGKKHARDKACEEEQPVKRSRSDMKSKRS